MNSLFIIGGSFAALLLTQVLTQSPDNPNNPANAVLLAPTPGAPLSAEQVDRLTRKLQGGSLAVEEVRSKVYRDSGGRLRIEELTGEGVSGLPSTVVLVDPGTGSKVMLMVEKKVALRWVVPKFGEEGFASMGGIGESLPPGKWKVETEKLGKRVAEGLELDGIRVTHTCEGQPSAARVEERWYSKDLNLIALAVASGPNGTHTATLQKLVHGDPDARLFSIPSEYNIRDIQLSDH